ncbi:MAG: hypothetical protein ACXWB0_00840 [Sulfuricurvum sp.]
MIEWLMMGAFIAGIGLAAWKLYYFFPSKRLADDDTTPESVELLERIMVETNRVYPSLSNEDLYQKMTEHPLFDPKHFWRFNQNRLHQFIAHYRLKEPSFRL